MPEAPPWRFQEIIKPLFDFPYNNPLLLGRIVTGRGDEVIEQGFIEVKNDRIGAVGPIESLGSRRADGIETTGTILPGLFNSHAHLAWDGIHDLAHQSLHDSPETSAYKAASNMTLSLRAGVTTVRDLGMNKTNLAAKQAVVQGIFPGPRLLVCGEAIVQTGGHTYWCCREASGPDEMRRAVREQVRGGADLIKIMASHDRLEFTDAELEAVIDEAHRNGLPITAHATFDKAIRRVAEFGVDCIEHGGNMTEDTIEVLLKRKIPIVTTFAPLVMQSQRDIAREYKIPEWKIAERQKAVADRERFEGIISAAKAGVSIGFGTDAGSPAVGHHIIAPEMKFMVDLGLVENNHGAIRSATTVAAQINRVENDLGTLEPGKLADLIVVNGNPLANLDDLSAVKMTFVAGKRMI